MTAPSPLDPEWTNGAIQKLVAICTTTLLCDPSDLFNVMVSESNASPSALNPNGHAAGLIQFMPATLTRLGWTFDTDAFLQLNVESQLGFVEKYFAPYQRKLNDATALYVATFLPAFLDFASDPDFVLAELDGIRSWIYDANAGFDPARRGKITIGDLTTRLQIVRSLPRWKRLAPILAVENDPPLATNVQIAGVLERLGYTVADGALGDVVRQFQADRMGPTEVDGVVGPKTRLALRTALQSGA